MSQTGCTTSKMNLVSLLGLLDMLEYRETDMIEAYKRCHLKQFVYLAVTFCVPLMFALADGDSSTLEKERLYYTTKAYQHFATEIFIQHINRVANAIGLNEQLPVTSLSLTDISLVPPGYSDMSKLFGTISTHNYVYSASEGNKFNSIVMNFGANDANEQAYLDSIKQRYRFRDAPNDTNAAIQLAESWLIAFGVDVKSLNRDCVVRSTAWSDAGTIIPVYYVRWLQPSDSFQKIERKANDARVSIAAVQLLLPEHKLIQLHVKNANYLISKELSVANREELLQEGDNQTMNKRYVTSRAYQNAASALLLCEVNDIVKRLDIDIQRPVTLEHLRDYQIETPYYSDHLGRFGYLISDKYSFYANRGNKINVVTRTMNRTDEGFFLAQVKARYSKSNHNINTNNAIKLGMQFLAEMCVDVEDLQSNYVVSVEPWKSNGQILPVYDVIWKRAKEDRTSGQMPAATVRLVEPESNLVWLVIEETDLIRRKALKVPLGDRGF